MLNWNGLLVIGCVATFSSFSNTCWSFETRVLLLLALFLFGLAVLIAYAIAFRYESIRVEVYRDFVLDWYKRHPLEDAGD